MDTYRVGFKIDGDEVLLIWLGNAVDQADRICTQDGRLLMFYGLSALDEYAMKAGFAPVGRRVTWYDFDKIQRWLCEVDAEPPPDSELLNAWNIITDCCVSLHAAGARLRQMDTQLQDVHGALSERGLAHLVLTDPQTCEPLTADEFAAVRSFLGAGVAFIRAQVELNASP